MTLIFFGMNAQLGKLKMAVLSLGFCLLTSPIWAQLSPYETYVQVYDDAVELFEKEKYGAAEKKVEEFLHLERGLRGQQDNDLHANALFIQAISGYFLDRNNALGLLRGFVRKYPINTKAPVARYYLGNYYFNRQDYGAAAIIFQEAYDLGGLNAERGDEVLFNLAYSYFMEENYTSSSRYFEMAGKGEGKYTEDAQYYRSVILYQEEEYVAAYQAFKEMTESEKYGREVKVYLANTLLKLKKYDELNVLADDFITGPKPQGQESQVYYIVANAGFEREDYPRTTEYFQRYVKARGKMRPIDYYRYGYAHFQQSEYEMAIPLLKRASSQKDSLAQLADYYLGFAFQKQNNLPDAKTAFGKAAKSNLAKDPAIKEDAIYQYGKLSFAAEAYDDALTAFTELKEKFPENPHMDEVQSLIGEIYLYTRNYPRSIKYLESIPRTSNRTREAYQTVCYYYGLELFERPAFAKAIPFFEKATANAYNADMALSARYWKAESMFRMGRFGDARRAYDSFIKAPGASGNEHFILAYYGKGWTDFKEKKYTGAVNNFTQFLSKATGSTARNLIVDANLRTGDSHFLGRKYNKSITSYQKVIGLKYTYRDYAAYQMGEAYYRLGNYQQSVSTFEKLANSFKKSELRDNALDRASDIYVTWIKDYNKTITVAKKLVDEYPRSPLAGDAYNRLGLAYYNKGNANQAATYFKKVLTDYASDKKNAKIALDNLAGILSESEFDKVLRDYRKRAPDTDNNLASLVFNTGKDRFFAANYSSAIDQFSTYIKDYKNGPEYLEALIFRARSYRETGKQGKALQDYKTVYSTPTTNSFTNVALLEAAEIQYEQKEYLESLQLYQTLEETAGKLANQVQALFGIAKNHTAMGDHAAAEVALRRIADNPEAAVFSRTRARLDVGYAQYNQARLDDAFATFAGVEADFKNESGAESQFMIAQILYDRGMLLKAKGDPLASGKLEEVKDATRYQKNNYPTYNYWKAKTFLIAALAYYELGNAFQAKGTLESLVSEDRFPDVQEEAQRQLDRIEAEETAAGG